MQQATGAPMILRLFLALSSSLLTMVAMPGGPAPLAVFVGLVPWLLALGKATPRQGAGLGMAGGFAGWLISLRWLPRSIGAYACLHPLTAWGSTILFCVYAAVPYGLFGWLQGRFPAKRGPAASLEAAGLLAVLVHLFPVVLPGTPAHSLYRHPELIQLAGLGGVFLVLWFVFAVNCLAADFMASLLERRPRPGPLLCALALVVLVWGYGEVRLRSLDAAQAAVPKASIVITAIQPDIAVPQGPWPRAEADGHGLATLAGMTREAVARHPETDLVVWPEIPLHLASDPPSPAFNAVAALARELGVPILYQGTSVVGEQDRGLRFHNSVRLVTGLGRAGPRYDKSVLVPFAEYLPLEGLIPFLRDLFPGVGRYVPGDGPRLFPVKSATVFPAICYEAVFSGFVRQAVASGGNILVNVVDDAWFGDSPAPYFHLALVLFRAVEFSVPVVRVANSGIGAHVLAGGRIAPGSETPLFARAMTSFPVAVTGCETVYSRFGDAACLLVVLVLCLRIAAGKRRRAGA